MAYNGPKWQPKPGVTYILPGISYGAHGAVAGAKEQAREAIEELKSDPERRLINPRHPQHEEAVRAWNEWHEVLHGEPLFRETAEPDKRPYVSRLVRNTAEENPYHRQQDALQSLAEIFDDKKWRGPDGKGKHPLFDGSSPQHEAAVEEYKQLFEMAHPELKENE